MRCSWKEGEEEEGICFTSLLICFQKEANIMEYSQLCPIEYCNTDIVSIGKEGEAWAEDTVFPKTRIVTLSITSWWRLHAVNVATKVIQDNETANAIKPYNNRGQWSEKKTNKPKRRMKCAKEVTQNRTSLWQRSYFHAP